VVKTNFTRNLAVLASQFMTVPDVGPKVWVSSVPDQTDGETDVG